MSLVAVSFPWGIKVLPACALLWPLQPFYNSDTSAMGEPGNAAVLQVQESPGFQQGCCTAAAPQQTLLLVKRKMAKGNGILSTNFFF